MSSSPPISASKRQAASAAVSALGLKWVGLALIVLGVVRIFASLEHGSYRNDFAHYYLAANILAAGDDPYLTPIEPFCREYGLEYDPRITTGANPPLLICAVGLVAWLPLTGAYFAWVGIQAAALGILLTAIRRLLSLERDDPHWLLVVGVILNATCLVRQFHYSQVQVMVAAALAVALLCHLRGQHLASVALVTLAAAFKIYPAALIPWFVLSNLRGRRDLAERILACSAVLAAAVGVTGVDAWRGFVVDGLPVIQKSVGGSLTNYSLPAMVSTVAPEIVGGPLAEEASRTASLLGKLLAVGALGGAYLIVWRRRLDPVAALGIVTAGMLASSLVCWSHYFVLMIMPVAWLWQRMSASGEIRARWPLLFSASLCLWPELDWTVPVVGGVPRLALHYYPLASLLVLALLLATCLRRVECQGTAR